MNAVLGTPRSTMSPYAPRIFSLKIPTDKIRELIGPGGKMIRSIVEQTGCKIDVEDDGSVKIYSSDGAAADRAIQMVTDICRGGGSGQDVFSKVVRIVDFGPSSRFSPAPTGCCTSAKFQKAASSKCAMS